MKRMLSVFALPALLLAGSFSGALAQVTKSISGTVRYESGISNSSFTTPKGNVSVLLPQDMSGKILTGIVRVEPAGKDEREKRKNLNDLLKWSVSIAGQKISLSETPKSFDWLPHFDRSMRSPIELLNPSGAKQAELSLPPAIPTPAIDPDSPLQLTTPTNMLVKGDLLNVYTNKVFTPGENFVITDSRGRQFILQPICQSAQQAVISLPEDIAPGQLTVREEIWNSPITVYQPFQTKLSVVDLEISSPKTDLKPGERSEVIVAIVTNEKGEWVNPDIEKLITGQMSINLRNLNPQTVSMQGGNQQRVSFSPYEQPGRTEIRRDIVANTAGTFSVSVTLNEDFAISNDPFRPQLNAIQTPGEFNSWANALKSDLRQYVSLQNGDAAGDVIRSNAQRAINNLPVCTAQSNLAECKAVAASLLRPLNVPKGAASSWLSGYEAFKTAAGQLNAPAAIPDLELMRNGLGIIERMIYQQKLQHLLGELDRATQILDQAGASTLTPEQRSELDGRLQTLVSAIDPVASAGMWNRNSLAFETYSLDKRTKDGIDPKKSMIAFLDPEKKLLRVRPEHQQQVLADLKAVPAENGMFRIQSWSARRTPVTYLVQVGSLFMFNAYESDWWANRLIENRRKDSTAGNIIDTSKDSTGTWWIFYKDARCEKSDGEKIEKCREHETFVWDPKTQKGEFKKDGKYFTFEFLPWGSCKKGDQYCTEMWQIFRIDKIYADKECTRLIRIETIFGFSCR